MQDSSITSLEQQLLSVYSQEQLEDAITEKIKSYEGLLTREVAVKLIAREKGLAKNEPRFLKINEIKKGERNFSTSGKVSKIFPPYSYPSGKRIRCLWLEDETGKMPLILWDNDIAIFSKIKVGDQLVIKEAYEKNNEITLTYKGSVEKSGTAPFSPLSGLVEGGVVTVRGIVKKTNEKLYVTDGKKEILCIFEDNDNRIGRLNEGDEVILESVAAGDSGLILKKDSRMLLKQKKSTGMLENINTVSTDEGEKLKIMISGRELVLNREKALEFLKTSAPPDVSIETIVKLKKDLLLHSVVEIPVAGSSE